MRGHHAAGGGQGEEHQCQTQAPRGGFLTQLVVEHEDAGKPRNAQGVGPHCQGRHGQQWEAHHCGAERQHSGDRAGPLPAADSVHLRGPGGVETGGPSEQPQQAQRPDHRGKGQHPRGTDRGRAARCQRHHPVPDRGVVDGAAGVQGGQASQHRGVAALADGRHRVEVEGGVEGLRRVAGARQDGQDHPGRQGDGHAQACSQDRPLGPARRRRSSRMLRWGTDDQPCHQRQDRRQAGDHRPPPGEPGQREGVGEDLRRRDDRRAECGSHCQRRQCGEARRASHDPAGHQ